MLNKEFLEEWLKKLKAIWENKDIDSILELFKNTKYYYESPFEENIDNIEDIKILWKDIYLQENIKVDFHILAIQENTAIVEWKLCTSNQKYCEGVYEIKFNQELECTYFKQWFMER